MRMGRLMPSVRPIKPKKPKRAAIVRTPGRPRRPSLKLPRRASADSAGEIARTRAEAEAAIAEARKSHERLVEAIDILPQGIVFLDPNGRYILWNKKYAEIYSRSADLFQPGARLEDTIRIGVARGDYPEAVGREEEWVAERIARLYQPGERHEQKLADGRVILIEERLTADGGIIGLRVDITGLKQREASFRLLFDSNPVPMIVCALDDERILSVNDAAIAHYGYGRAEFEKLTMRSLQAFDSDPPWAGDRSGDEQAARTWKHVRADGTLIDLAIYSRHLVYQERPAVLLALMDITERKRAEARLAFLAQHDGLTGLPNRNLLRQQMDDMLMHRRQALARRSQAPALRAARGGRHRPPQLRRIRDRAGRREAARGCGAAGEAAAGGDRRALRARRPFRRDRRHHRHRDGARRRRRFGEAPEERRHGAVARQDRDARHLQLFRDRHGRARPEPPQDRDRPARRDPERRAAAVLSAAGRPCERAHHRFRGPGALASSRARHDIACRVHSRRRGDRADQRARRPDAAARLRRCRVLARPCPRRGQPVAGAVSHRQSAVGRDGRAEAVRPAGQAAGTGDHRNAAAGEEQPGAGDAACAARARRADFDGRFRHRLFQPELLTQLSVRQDQDRPVVRARPRLQPRCAGDRAFDHQSWHG